MANRNDEERNRGGGDGNQDSESHGSQGSGYGYQGGYGSYSSTAGVGGQNDDGVSNQEQRGEHNGRDKQPSTQATTTEDEADRG